MDRISEKNRKTFETDITMSLNIDGIGISKIDTGIGFFNHMLTLFAKHGLFDLNIKAIGDIDVDSHHTVEDVGIVLGNIIKEVIGDKKGINRYGTSYVPMDESLCLVSLDLSGRPYLVFEADFTLDNLGDFDLELVEEFFRAVAFNAGITLHAKILYGRNNHHMVEGLFKAFGRALREAVEKNSRIKDVMSTKGIL